MEASDCKVLIPILNAGGRHLSRAGALQALLGENTVVSSLLSVTINKLYSCMSINS